MAERSWVRLVVKPSLVEMEAGSGRDAQKTLKWLEGMGVIPIEAIVDIRNGLDAIAGMTLDISGIEFLKKRGFFPRH